MPPDRRNLRGRLKKLEREREKMAAQARANRRGIAFSGPYTTTGRGSFSAYDLARLRERGHYVHVIGVVRMAGETSRSYGAQDTDDASAVSGDCEMLDATTTLADLRAYNAALDEVELVRTAIYERLLLGSGLAEALDVAVARVVTSRAWTAEVEVGPETEVALLVGALSEARYEAVEDAYPVDGVEGSRATGSRATRCQAATCHVTRCRPMRPRARRSPRRPGVRTGS